MRGTFAAATRLMWRCGIMAIGCLLSSANVVHAGLPVVAPEEVGLSAERLGELEPLIEQGLTDHKFPGCVVCIGRQGKIAWLKAYGQRQVAPEPVPMTTETLFDLASLTKPIATACSTMWLVEHGKLDLDAPVVRYRPEFGQHGKEAITIRDLLLHRSGLIAGNPTADYQQGREVAWQKIDALSLKQPVGSKFIYSDINFLVLGWLAEQASGEPLDKFTREKFFAPLGMTSTGYLPSAELRQHVAPTQQRNGEWIRGDVHDPRAFALGGVAGHAGLFSTAEDLAIFAQMLLNGGEYQGVRVLQPETVATMTQGYPVSAGRRALGWDQQTGYSINRGQAFSEAAFGHGGFTGTVIWIDPANQLFFIFLSNRVHPDGKGLVNPLAGEIANVIDRALIRAPEPAAPPTP